jgi:hypothetical protein
LLCGLNEKGIADSVAVQIVYSLEVVKVDEQ